jgi:hypothetical protein
MLIFYFFFLFFFLYVSFSGRNGAGGGGGGGGYQKRNPAEELFCRDNYLSLSALQMIEQVMHTLSSYCIRYRQHTHTHTHTDTHTAQDSIA